MLVVTIRILEVNIFIFVLGIVEQELGLNGYSWNMTLLRGSKRHTNWNVGTMISCWIRGLKLYIETMVFSQRLRSKRRKLPKRPIVGQEGWS